MGPRTTGPWINLSNYLKLVLVLVRFVVKISVRSIRLLSNRQRYNNKTSTSISISSFQELIEPDILSQLLVNVECTLSSFAGRGWTR